MGVAVVMVLALPSLLKGLPDPLPTHFDGMGRANGWTPHRVLPFQALGLAGLVWGLLLLGPVLAVVVMGFMKAS